MRYEDTKKSRVINKIENFITKLALVSFFVGIIACVALFTYAAVTPNLEIEILMKKNALSFLVWLIFVIFLLIICKAIKDVMYEECVNNKPEKYFHNTPFKAKLLSITSDIIVYDNVSKRENIRGAKMTVVEDIIVQKTYIDNVYREVVTGKILHSTELDEPLAVAPVRDDEKATSKELEEYISSHTKEEYKDGMSFDEYLDYLKECAEGYYDNYEKEKLTEEDKINRILKNYSKVKTG